MKKLMLLITILSIVSALLFVSIAVAADSYHGDVKSKIFHNAYGTGVCNS